MRFLLTITYDGENFSGWQKQPGRRTVQGEIEKALFTALKEKITITGSGRTDAGVNAERQVAHFDCKQEITNLDRLAYSLNGILESDVKILSIEKSDIHARFSAKRKTYKYQMYLSKIVLPLKKKRLRIDNNIDIEMMKSCAKLLIGEHDFKNFCATNSQVESTIRRIYSCKFVKEDDNLDFYITGNGFLYKMVRNIVGLLIEVGKGKVKNTEFEQLAFGKKVLANKTVAGENLFLYEVKY